jgi:3-phenylpropionate/trans-cinnamate dioxygenase ferredoxin subunit
VPGEYVRVCAPEDVAEGEPRRFHVPGPADPARVLVRIGRELFALGGVCTHEGADLSEGVVDRGILWCPVHSSGFDCRTGAVVHPPAVTALRTYPVVTREDGIYVGLEEQTSP